MSHVLARALLVAELLPRAQLGRLLARSVLRGRALAVELAEEDQDLVLAALAKDPTPLVADPRAEPQLYARLPAGMAERLGIVPLADYSDATLTGLAMMDPTDANAAREVERLLGTPIMRLRARPDAVLRALAAVRDEGNTPERPTPLHTPAMYGTPSSHHYRVGETPPFGSLGNPLHRDEDDDDDGEEPIPLVRKAAHAQLGPPPMARPWMPSHTEMPARLETATSTGAPQPFAAEPRNAPAPRPTASLPPRPRSYAPGALPGAGLHALSRMPVDEYAARLSNLKNAKHRDDVLGELLALSGAYADSVLLMAAKGDRYVGWAGSIELGDVRPLEVSAREATVFTRALVDEGFLGALPRIAAHEPLFTKLIPHYARAAYEDGELGLEVAVWPVVVARRPVLFLVASGLTDPLVATQRFAEACRLASEALLRLLRTKK